MWFEPMCLMCSAKVSGVDMCIRFVVPGRHFSLGVIHPLWILDSFNLFFLIDILALRDEGKWRNLKLKCSKVSNSLRIVQLWISVLVTNARGTSRILSETLIYRYRFLVTVLAPRISQLPFLQIFNFCFFGLKLY